MGLNITWLHSMSFNDSPPRGSKQGYKDYIFNIIFHVTESYRRGILHFYNVWHYTSYEEYF